MKSWYARSREYHTQQRRSADGSCTSVSGTRSASPDEFHSATQSTAAPSMCSYSDHFKRGPAWHRRPLPTDIADQAATEVRPESTLPRHPVDDGTTSSRRCPVAPLAEAPAESPRHAASALPAVTAALRPRTDYDWDAGVRAAAHLARSSAQWEREKASLVHSRDTLEASLRREQCMRGELEDQVRTLHAECASLKSKLATAIGSPHRLRVPPQGTQDPSDGSHAQVCLPWLITALRDYDRMLRDLQQLQRSPRAEQTFLRYPITVHDDVAAFLLDQPSSSSPLHPSARGEVLSIITSPPPSRRLELEHAAASPDGHNTVVGEEAASSEGQPSGNVEAVVFDTGRGDRHAGIMSPPRAEDAAPSPPSSSAAAELPVGPLALSPPPPFMRSATRSPPHDTQASLPTWRGPMHEFQCVPTGASSSSAAALDDAHVARPLYGSPPTALEREEAILETDKLTVAFAEELTRLAAAHEAVTASAKAALCGERGLDYLDVDFLPVTASLGPGGCRVSAPPAGADVTVQFQHIRGLLPPGRRAELISSAGLDPCAVKVGLLHDRGVAAGLAALAEASGAVTSLFASTTSENEDNGLTRVWLCVSGVWTLVELDSYLPVVRDDSMPSSTAPRFYGCANALTFDLWPAVCEKALAKTLGSYRAVAELEAATTLGLLTGGPVELWDWWRARLDVAYEEIEAAINTSVRGSGIVLLTTHSALSTHTLSQRDTSSSVGESELGRKLRAAGLSPGTAYRVLAAAEDESGQRMLLIRMWESTAGGEAAHGEADSTVATSTPRHRRLSPLREEPLDSSDSHLHAVELAAHGDGSSCAWLSLHRDVASLFELCHVCFDCRRFHDVRIPVAFHGHDPCTPSCILRVTVRRPHHLRAQDKLFGAPARLWIGLHQPVPHGGTTTAGFSTSSLDYCGLKVALLVPELDEAAAAGRPHRHSLGEALSGPPTHSVSESFGGHFQTRPSVWMYVEMDASTSSPVSFYIIPQLDLSNDQNTTGVMAGSSSSAATRTAVIALLAEEKDLFDVQPLEAPLELPAALCHGGLACLDLSSCDVFSNGGGGDDAGLQAQVNGRWIHHFEW